MKKTFLKHKDGTIEDSEGNIVFFSLDRFIDNICEGDNCFLCGASRVKKEFNNEHIIPKWLLRKFDLFRLSITLPNNETIRYGKYTVPCCSDCNAFLGKRLESDIQSLVESGYSEMAETIKKDGPWKLFLWLSLIFFKTHLKDSLLRKHLDKRKGEELISDDYEWGFLHHIHGMVTALKNGSSIEPECLGSLFILSAKTAEHYGNYDYRDIYAANTILLRIGEIAFVAVLDDSCATLNFFKGHYERIDGPLSPLQLREFLSHLTLLNCKLKYRPQYSAKVDADTGEVTIVAELPDKMELEKHSPEELGEILYGNVSQIIEQINDKKLNDNIDNIKAGYFHFLFDHDGKFMKNCMDLVVIDEQTSHNKRVN